MESNKIEAEWVVLKYDEKPNVLICNRCGERVIAPHEGIGGIGVSIDTWLRMVKAFTAAHKQCKEPDKEVIKDER